MIKTWKKYWGSLCMDNESLNPITENNYEYRNTLTLPCFDPTFRCINLKYRIDLFI